MIIKLNSAKLLVDFSMQHEEDSYRVVCRDATGLHYLLVATDFVSDRNVYFVPSDLFIEYCCKHRALNVSNACALSWDKEVRVWYSTEERGCTQDIARFKEVAGHPFYIVGMQRYTRDYSSKKDGSNVHNIFGHRYVGVLNLATYTVQVMVARKNKNVWFLYEEGGMRGFDLTVEQSEKFKTTMDIFDKIDKETVGYAAITYPEAPFLFLDKDWAEELRDLIAEGKDAINACSWIQMHLLEYINSIRPSTVKVTKNFLSLTTQSKAFKNPFPCVILKFNLKSSSFKAYKKGKASHTISFVDYLKQVAENWSESEIATELMDEYATLRCE